MKSILAFAVMLIVLCIARAADPANDIPNLPPATSTAFVCMVKGKAMVVAIALTYSNGKLVRFDVHNMHGFTPQQLQIYHDTAQDKKIYMVPCENPAVST